MESVQSAIRAVPPDVSAREAGLAYVNDQKPGISRVASGDGFKYLSADGTPITDDATLSRIRSLVIPPKWSNVWICPTPKGHLQATGRDARGRKQYRYHHLYRMVREETKYGRMILFGELLPNIRLQVHRDLSLRGLPKRKVLATVVRLMDVAHVRIGNEEYARENQSYGLTTMRDKHVQIDGSVMRFHFKGKSGKVHDLEISDRRLASIVRQCRDLPGYELFRYVDESGEVVSIDSAMVNQYLREITGEDISAKDFRTWHGTVHAAVQLGSCAAGASESEAKHNIIHAIKVVAERLGNRPATCRKYYIHPLILDAYSSGKLPPDVIISEAEAEPQGLNRAERCVLDMLRREQLASMPVNRTPARGRRTRNSRTA